MSISKKQKRTRSHKKSKTQKGRGYEIVEGYEYILTKVSEILLNSNKITQITLSSNGIDYTISKNTNFNPQYEHKEISVETVRNLLNAIPNSRSYVKANIAYY